MKTIWVNGEELTTVATTLAELVNERVDEQAAVASALNGNFVPVSKRSQTPLNDNDRLEILMPVQGG